MVRSCSFLRKPAINLIIYFEPLLSIVATNCRPHAPEYVEVAVSGVGGQSHRPKLPMRKMTFDAANLWVVRQPYFAEREQSATLSTPGKLGQEPSPLTEPIQHPEPVAAAA